MYSNVYVTSAQKKTCVDYHNIPNHHTSIYLGWGGYEGCMAVKAYDSKVHVLSVWQQTCMLPRELIWEGVAPPHNGVTQYSRKASANNPVKHCRRSA